MGEPTLHDFLLIARTDPLGDLRYRLMMAKHNADYLGIVQDALRYSLNLMVENRRHKQGLEEDALNVQIVENLQMAGLPAKHDVKYGGHTDVSVRLGIEFLWIAECKLWKGCAWAFSGLKQLGRYTSGLDGQERNALILYVFDPDAGKLLKKWRLRLAKLASRVKRVEDVKSLSFTSVHAHLSTGTDLFVSHIAVPLYWNSDSASA